MTIKEIVNALECHGDTVNKSCDRCVYRDLSAGECSLQMVKDACELINNVFGLDFQTILMCALRYSLGRRSYMPALVIGYITPLLPELSDNTLTVMERDISTAGDYGDKVIDEPSWMKFLEAIHKEQERRK